MENMLYFAVFGKEDGKLRKNCGCAYGGFGFAADGTLRMPYIPPEHSVILFDDRFVPLNAEIHHFCEMIKSQKIKTVIFDFEKPKNDVLCRLVLSVQTSEKFVPEQYAGICSAGILVSPYTPKEPFAAYIRRMRAKHSCLLLDLRPIGCSVNGGKWTQSKTAENRCGRFSEANQCLYQTRKNAAGTEIYFYDTQKTLLSRASAAGVPCLLPLAEFERLPSE